MRARNLSPATYCPLFEPGCNPAYPGCNLTYPRCDARCSGCNPMHPRLQPHASQAATLRAPGLTIRCSTPRRSTISARPRRRRRHLPPRLRTAPHCPPPPPTRLVQGPSPASSRAVWWVGRCWCCWCWQLSTRAEAPGGPSTRVHHLRTRRPYSRQPELPHRGCEEGVRVGWGVWRVRGWVRGCATAAWKRRERSMTQRPYKRTHPARLLPTENALVPCERQRERVLAWCPLSASCLIFCAVRVQWPMRDTHV